LEITKGLGQADPVILQSAPTFFGITRDGSLDLAQIIAAKLYDKTKGAVTIKTALDQALLSIGSFQRGTKVEITAMIAKARKKIMELEPVLESIRTRRNEGLAHLDPRTVASPGQLPTKAKLTMAEVERVFRVTEDILLDLDSYYESLIGDLQFLGHDDYRHALDLIRRAKCAQIREYEKQFGTWTGPRPKDCTKKSYDLI
jgi:hypothetical protein